MTELERIIATILPSNILAAEFALVTEEDVANFLANDWNLFSLVCLSEAFDECVVMMRRMFNWDMLDITYLRLLDSVHSDGML